MSRFPDGWLTSNRGLTAGGTVTEIRLHPFINDNQDWDYHKETVHFKILEVYKCEYKCQYLDTEDNAVFYWPFWDEQPNYGFLINQCSPVSYYSGDTITE